MSQIALGSLTLTPNRRLARALEEEFARTQLAAGRTVWETPRILPWDAWLAQLWREALTRTASDAAPPRLLSRLEESTLWEAIIAASDALDPLLPAARVTPEAMLAWRTLHAEESHWREVLSGSPGQGPERFRTWAEQFEKRCQAERWIDAARLATALLHLLPELRPALPASLRLIGFERFTAQQERLLAKLAAEGCALEVVPSPAPGAEPRLATFVDAQAEFGAAAAWAAEWMRRDPEARIGVVVANLAQRREEVLRAFREALAPAWMLAPWEASRSAFEISLGEPLADQPLIAVALEALSWARQGLALERWAALLRSPYLAGDAEDRRARGALERALAEAGISALSLGQTLQQCRLRQQAPVLAQALGLWLAQLDASPARQLPSAWRKQWEQELAALGWPGEASLNSAEFQAREAWVRLLDDWKNLDTLMGPVKRESALASLRQAARETLFQPEGQGARVAILGPLEAAGQCLDALWVTGLQAGVWPPDAAPNPFLPIVWQKRRALPQASAEAALSAARARLRGYLGATGAAVFSRPLSEGEELLVASPLWADWPNAPRLLETIAPMGPLAAVAKVARCEDARAEVGLPLVSAELARVSSGTLDAQAQCPFQAYGRYRLGAESWPGAGAGLSSQERGKLVHWALARFWQELRSRQALVDLAPGARDMRVDAAVAFALERLGEPRWRSLPEFVLGTEAACLKLLLAQWLKLEEARPDFAVQATETAIDFSIEGLSLRLRPDRIDELADQRRLIIDYKTGAGSTLADWLDAPLGAVQLPLYALIEPSGQVAALAIGRVLRTGCKVEGLAADPTIWPALTPVKSGAQSNRAATWRELTEFWRGEIERLARDYGGGDARLAPRRGVRTCQTCALPALCRIAEQRGAQPLNSDMDEADDADAAS